MTAFEDLKLEWKNQSQPEIPTKGAKEILKKIVFVRNKQRIMNVVLTATIVVLIAFFFYISAYKFQSVMIGLLIMIGALTLRIGLELLSIQALKTLDVSTSADEFKRQMIQYYKRRTRVHFLLTPLIIIAYIIGFLMLLPAFKANLSNGFYWYICISSIVLLIFIGAYIAAQIRKELLILKGLTS